MAGRGKVIHAYLSRVRAVGVEAALVEQPAELRPYLELLDINELPTHLACEVAMGYDWKARTAREIGRDIGRDYKGHLERTGQAPQGATEVFLTIDYVGGEERRDMKRGVVGDYKSGRTKYPAPDKYGQTLLAGLAASKCYGYDECFLDLVYIDEDGENYRARRKVDAWDLEAFADEFERAMGLVEVYEAEVEAGRDVNVTEGPHCDYCPAWKSCRAKIALVRNLPTELATIAPRGPGTIQRTQAAAAWIKVEQLREALNMIADEIIAMAGAEDIELPDGRVIGHVLTKRDAVDGQVAAAVLEQWYGADTAKKAITIKVSKDAIKDAVRDNLKPGEKIATKKGDGVFDRIISELRRRNGIAVNTTDNIRPFMPKRR